MNSDSERINYVAMNFKGQYLTRNVDIHSSDWTIWQGDLQRALVLQFPLSKVLEHSILAAVKEVPHLQVVIIKIEVIKHDYGEIKLLDMHNIFLYKRSIFPNSDRWKSLQKR